MSNVPELTRIAYIAIETWHQCRYVVMPNHSRIKQLVWNDTLHKTLTSTSVNLLLIKAQNHSVCTGSKESLIYMRWCLSSQNSVVNVKWQISSHILLHRISNDFFYTFWLNKYPRPWVRTCISDSISPCTYQYNSIKIIHKGEKNSSFFLSFKHRYNKQ